VRILLDATNPAGRTLDTSGSETYAALQNLAPGWSAESVSNGTKASQPGSANDAGTGLKGILPLGDSNFLLGNLTAITGPVFVWTVARLNTYTSNRQVVSMSNSTAVGQQWFSAPRGLVPLTSTFTANQYGSWHPSNYRGYTTTNAANDLISATAYTEQTAPTGRFEMWRNNSDFQFFTNSDARGNLDRISIGGQLGSVRAFNTFFEFGLVLGEPTSGQRAALHTLLQAKYTGL
jgi:hypothetical protein